MAVSKLQYAIGNNASTTSSSSVSNSDTSVPLTSSTNFQAKSGEGMYLVDEGQAAEELAYATGLSGSSLTTPLVNRGLEGGTAQAHTSGATVKGVISAGMWNNIIDSLLLMVNQSDGKFAFLKDSAGTQIAKPITGYLQKPSSICIQVFAGATDTSTGEGKAWFVIPPELAGMKISDVFATVITTGTTGLTTIAIRNASNSTEVLSTSMTIDSTENSTATAATPAVINASNATVAANDLIAIDVDAVHTTPAKGLVVRITFGF